ncbi:uncharacterized protein PSANT_06998 [Moesziomyces antarcticus]|nr:uncharacterized protein PSANT_06998 [Moesziomyces antarcticus]
MSFENDSEASVATSLAVTAPSAPASSASGSGTISPTSAAASRMSTTLPSSSSVASVSFATQLATSPQPMPSSSVMPLEAQAPSQTQAASRLSPASQVGLGSPDIIFEFSNRRWRTTAGFLQMELMSGMRLAVRPGLPSDGLHASQRVSVKLVQLVEPVADVAPNFRVWSNQPEQPDQMEVIWDYQVEGQLPTIRALVSVRSAPSPHEWD